MGLKNIFGEKIMACLSFLGSWYPFKVQVMMGVGLPLELHLSDTRGPGCKVWSMNR
jgi:hypothetical protein